MNDWSSGMATHSNDSESKLGQSIASTNSPSLVPLTIHSDDRGDLFALQENGSLSFKPERVFILRNLDCKGDRACHAVSCDEFLVPLSGRCQMEVQSLSDKKFYDLDDHNTGIYVPAGLWMRLSDFSEDFVAMVICSQRFEDTVYFHSPQI